MSLVRTGTGVDLTRRTLQIKRSATRRNRPHGKDGTASKYLSEKKLAVAASQQDLHQSSTAFAHVAGSKADSGGIA
jgi:hypothetical protein